MKERDLCRGPGCEIPWACSGGFEDHVLGSSYSEGSNVRKRKGEFKKYSETMLSLHGPTDVQEKNINCFEITFGHMLCFF